MSSPDPFLPPIRLMTRLLAEMQTSIVSAGLRAFDGDLDRFVIFTVVGRQSLTVTPGGEGPVGTPISMHALANSLSRPYETVRRHVHALIDEGICERQPNGVISPRESLTSPTMQALTIIAHDSFVRFVEDLAALGVALPMARPDTAYDPRVGVRNAADLMLAVTDTNRAVHTDWGELTVYSTILCANVRRFAHDPVLALRYADQRASIPRELWQPVRPSVVARMIGLSESTVRRRIAALLADGRVEQWRRGLVVSEAWLNRPESVATSTGSYHNIRRILERAAAAGFPFESPASAYLAGRPAGFGFDSDQKQ
jgi:DNA-binding Lrp family transcriptional regulator